jgi:conjugal transfer/type IV secretion protein DotA/TraY
VNRVDSGTTTTWNFGDQSGVYSANVCGSIVYTMPQPLGASTWNPITDLGVTGANGFLPGNSYQATINRAEADLALAHINGTDQMIRDLGSLGFALASANPPDAATVKQQLDAAEATYKSTYLAAMRTAIHWGTNQTNQNIQSSDLSGVLVGGALTNAQAGWAFAGGWFYDLAATNSRLSRVVGSQQAVSGNQNDSLDPTLRSSIESTDAFVTSRTQSAVQPIGSPTINYLTDYQNGTLVSKLLTKIFLASFTTSIPPWQNTMSADNPPHPLILVKEAGEWMMAASEGAYATLLAVNAVGAAATGNVVSSALGASSVFSVIQNTVITPLVLGLLAVFAFGATLAYYIPMVPYIYWIMGVVGWMVVVFEAVLAAPLWAVMHMHPEGEGLAGHHAARGYMLILEIFMKPLMMIFGLIGAFLVAKPLMWLLNATFFSYTNSMTSDVNSITAFLGWLFGIMVYCGLAVVMMHKSFSLIHLIPEKVMEWIGHGARPLDPGGSHEAKSVFGGGVAYIGKTIQTPPPAAGMRGPGMPQLPKGPSVAGAAGAAKNSRSVTTAAAADTATAPRA